MPNPNELAVEILRKRGPLSSGCLASEIEATGTTASSARKIIERARKANFIESTHPVRFDKQHLYYLEAHRGRRYARGVRLLLEHKPNFQRVFKTLLANGGFITEGQIAKAANCLPPGIESRASGRPFLPEAINELLHLGIIDQIAGESFLYRLGTQFGGTKFKPAGFRHRLNLDQALVSKFSDWLRNCYLLSSDSRTIRSNGFEAVPFNETYWDIHGPLFAGPFAASPLLRRSSAAQEFLLGEQLSYRQFDLNDLQSTQVRLEAITRRWKNILLVPIVLARSFSKDALKSLRGRGVVPVTLADVFGPNIDALLKEVWQALSPDADADTQVDSISKSLALSESTVVDDGFVGNLKGILFELIIALAFKNQGFDVTLQKKVRKAAEVGEYEIDIVAVKQDSVCKLIECKGRHRNYVESRDNIERHFEDRIQAAADPYGWNVCEKYGQVEAMFITSGKIGESENDYCNTKNKGSSMSFSLVSRAELLDMLDRWSENQLRKLITKYY